MNASRFLAGALNGLMGGLLGLGGAALRLPGFAALQAPETVVLRNAGALVVVVAAWMCRARVVPLEVLALHLDIVASLLAGSLAGAWWAAGKTRAWRAAVVLLAGLAVALAGAPALPWVSVPGVLAGAGIGILAGFNATCGLLLAPAIVVLFDLDIKLAGSLALTVAMPMLLVGLLRVPGAQMLAVVHARQPRLTAVACGSVTGAVAGTVLLGVLPSRSLMTLLEALLVYAAFLNFVIFPRLSFYAALMQLRAFFTKFLRLKS